MAAEKAIAENAATGVTKVSGMAQIAANQRNGAKRREGTQARRYRKVEPAQVPRDKGWIAVPQLRRSASPMLVWQRGPKRVVSLGIGNARIDKSAFVTCGHRAPLR